MDNPAGEHRKSLLRGSFGSLANLTRLHKVGNKSQARKSVENTPRHSDTEDNEKHAYGRVNEEVQGPHDDDFHEHLNMVRSHSFQTKHGGFAHMYEKRPGPRDKNSQETFHGIMNYHGYQPAKSKNKAEVDYEKTEGNHHHRVTAHLNNKGDVSSIMHREHHKDDLKESVGMKKLRDIVPKTVKLDIEQPTEFPDGAHITDQEPKRQERFMDMHKVSQFPDRNGNTNEPFQVVKVASGKDGKMLAPDVGFKEAPHKLRQAKGLEEDVEQVDEISKERAKHYKKAFDKDLKKPRDMNDKSWWNKKFEKRVSGANRAGQRSAESDYYGRRGFKKANEEIELDERDTERHSVEHYDAKERVSKAKWHYDRAGKHKHASLAKGVGHSYHANLLKAGVIDAEGKQKSFREEAKQVDEISKGTLGRYINKAANDIGHTAMDQADADHVDDMDAMDSNANRWGKRERGIRSAVDRLKGRAKIGKRMKNYKAT